MERRAGSKKILYRDIVGALECTYLKELAVRSYFIFLIACEVGESCVEVC